MNGSQKGSMNSAINFAKDIIQSKLFIFGLIIKIILLFTPASHYVTDLFIPFINNAVLHFGENPWQISPIQNFPYGSFLFTVLYLPKILLYLIFGSSVLDNLQFSVFLIKLILLFFDFAFLLILRHFVDFSTRRLMIFYWLNPILIYISFVHGQLDAVVMSMTCLSLLLLTKDKIKLSALCFSFALLAKFHVAALIPFILSYLWVNYFPKESIPKIINWITVVLLGTCLGFLPLFLSHGAGYASTGSPEALRVFSMQFILSPQNSLYFGILLYLILLGRLIISTRISKSGLFYGCGALLSLLVVITNPMPGWYYWILPFWAVTSTQYRNLPKSLWIVFILSYFFYFEINQYISTGQNFNNLILTILQTSVIGFLGALIYLVLPFECPISRRAKPTMIGLAGDSGSGKNYFASVLQDLFGSKNTLTIEGDDYHRWERGNENWHQMTHLNPQANNLSELHNHAFKISTGQAVMMKHYDHSTGKFTDPRELTPSKTIIFQGLHTFFSNSFCNQMDLKIFLNPSDIVRKSWKIKRDFLLRGHDKTKILETMVQRETDSIKFINPQKQRSDWVIEFLSTNESLNINNLDAIDVNLYMIYELSNEPGVYEFFESLQSFGIDLKISSNSEALDKLKIVFSHTTKTILNIDLVKIIADSLFPFLRPTLRSYFQPKWRPGFDGINQLTTVYLMRAKIERDI